jgi:hypothetical protein
MKHLLGFIELRGTYYNFRPQYECCTVDGEFRVEKIPYPEMAYPTHGIINLQHDNKYTGSRAFLESLNMDVNVVFSLRFDEVHELDEHGYSGIDKKINLIEMLDNKVDLRDRFNLLSDFNMFKVVTVPREAQGQIYELLANCEQIFVNESYEPHEKVMLCHNGIYMGPYELQERKIDSKSYIRAERNENYILKCFKEEPKGIQKLDFVRNHYEGTVCVEVAYVPPACPLYDLDVMTSDILLEKISLSNNEEDFMSRYKTSPFLADNLPNAVREARYNKIKNIFSNIKKDEEEKINIAKIILESLKDAEKKSELSAIIDESVIENTKYKNIERERDEAFAELKSANDTIAELQEEIKQSSHAREIMSQIDEAELAERVRRRDELNAKIAELESRYGVYDDLDRIEGVIQVKEFNKARLNNTINRLGEIESELREKIVRVRDEIDPVEMAFEPVIANEMLKAAGQWQKDEEEYEYVRRNEELIGFYRNIPQKSNADLVEYLVSRVKAERAYSRNEIINIYTCVMQGFLTIFSGKPGTGKTSMCNIIADCLGLKNETAALNRFVPISVERGWSSKRDLIGYYNPLTKKYDKSNKGIYDALMTLTRERDNSLLPYLVLLDEANLSPIEYYWSVFMAATEIDSPKTVTVEIGTEEPVYVPETLKFIATINNDQTTEPLSPRLIDRAWVVKLPVPKTYDVRAARSEAIPANTVRWADLKSVFVEAKKIDTPKLLADTIYPLFDEYQMEISPRIRNVINHYISVAQELMESEPQASGKTQRPEQAALDFVVVQKLLPKINGFYASYERFFERLLRHCEANNLVRTESAIESMKKLNEDNNMGYCQFLV